MSQKIINIIGQNFRKTLPLGRTDVHYVIGTEDGNLYGINSHGECLVKIKAFL